MFEKKPLAALCSSASISPDTHLNNVSVSAMLFISNNKAVKAVQKLHLSSIRCTIKIQILRGILKQNIVHYQTEINWKQTE